jgi:hypothetical protein
VQFTAAGAAGSSAARWGLWHWRQSTPPWTRDASTLGAPPRTPSRMAASEEAGSAENSWQRTHEASSRGSERIGTAAWQLLQDSSRRGRSWSDAPWQRRHDTAWAPRAWAT